MIRLTQTPRFVIAMGASFLVLCSCASLVTPQMSDLKPSPGSADLVIADMFFTPGTGGTPEFPNYDMHVIVKNQGKVVTQSNNINVKVWDDESSVHGIRFRPVVPVAVVLGNLDPGQTGEAVWKNVVTTGRSYFLAVVDIPTTQFPLGREK